jgi:hypothetical protein
MPIENPIIAILDPKAGCKHTALKWLKNGRYMKGRAVLSRKYTQGNAYISAERFLDRKWENSSGSTNCRHLSRS